MIEQQCIFAYLDGLPPIGDASQQATVNALRAQCSSERLQFPSLRYGDASQSHGDATQSILERASKGEW
jgi:hypothetical protein